MSADARPHLPVCPGGQQDARANEENEEEPRQLRERRRYRWAELMQRVFEIDVLVCEHYGGRRRVLMSSRKPWNRLGSTPGAALL